jgi:hypothetical protein
MEQHVKTPAKSSTKIRANKRKAKRAAKEKKRRVRANA